jgi:hypothetical protein
MNLLVHVSSIIELDDGLKWKDQKENPIGNPN